MDTTMFEAMADIVPQGNRGQASVSHFQISSKEAEFSKLRAELNPGREVSVRSGRYCRLTVAGQTMMTDTPMEHNSNREFVQGAKGRVLIAGLGIGMVLVPLLKNPQVSHITVMEKSLDVIELVAPSFHQESDRLTILHQDCFDGCPKGLKFQTIYFDIWPTICGDNWPEMRKLHRKYRSALEPAGWMGSWQQTTCQRLGRRP